MIDNPDYDEQMKEYRDRRGTFPGYSSQEMGERPSKKIQDRVLETEITEDEFNTLKNSVLREFK